ncbi:AttE component of AttEFGH ABC transport system [Candidatus Rhodobacter oscarellae]|uniref:AttE component of AttEFGH ABC transport system n=1 Tax=Candidatus Rhodobacter oscarellae TaxID=1675527 RepID=A0A0J9E0K8_9RHOB|nr:ABC transporter ATP-binding protein [Candidatus Rhodobacter lobularis]KMW56481.1 AttE component of AttEFGH ABC transport system [Candidatus Rhodobacter lobularis]
MTRAAVLTISDVWKSFPGDTGPIEVLRGVSLDLPGGDTLALTGESGSGKSTLLHLAGALDAPNKGQVSVLGHATHGLGDSQRAALRRDHISVVFQQFNLIPSLNVRDNISFQARLAGRGAPEWCATLADKLGLADHLTKFPEQLSGGQQQRVAIGRALAGRPALVLADEPTGNLDEATGDAVLDVMLYLVRETDAALLMVTHSKRVAGRMARRLHLRGGQLV